MTNPVDGPVDRGATVAVRGKNSLRHLLLAGREARSAYPSISQERARDRALLTHPVLRDARCVALYVAFGHEPGTEGLRRALAARGVTVLLPRSEPDDSLTFAADVSPLRPGRRGQWEPAGHTVALALADVVMVPALAVDRAGTRLGRGGGSYDRALAGLRAPVIALLHPGELVRHLPREPHDEPVTAAALPGGVVWLGDRASG